MGRHRIYTDEERRARKRDAHREWKRKRSVLLYGTLEERASNEKQRIQDVVTERCVGFEFAGNFTGSDGSADIRCTVCGTVTTRAWTTIKQGKPRCHTCEERAKRKEQITKVRNEFVKAANIKSEQVEMKTCARCGAAFVGRRKLYCSDECARAEQNKRGVDKRVRRIGERLVDRDITFRKVFDRDGGTCCFCGGTCDWSDYKIVNGQKEAGNYYPSVDHIVPLSKGGEHSWNNVRLAHRICNTKSFHAPCLLKTP